MRSFEIKGCGRAIVEEVYSDLEGGLVPEHQLYLQELLRDANKSYVFADCF